MYNPRWLFFIPGAILAGLGTLFAALLLFGPLVVVNNISLDLNTFMAACFMIVAGVQLLTFGVISETLRDDRILTGNAPSHWRPDGRTIAGGKCGDLLRRRADVLRLCGGAMGAAPFGP